jgi:transcriptional regulator with XRE-family HTH domain
MSMSELARRLGRSRMFINRIECFGSAKIDDATAEAMARELDVPVEELFVEVER